MNSRSRREFLADVGRGMLVASLGSAAALELGLTPSLAEESSQRLTFGQLEPLVSLMQETPPDKLLPLLVSKAEGRHGPQNARHFGRIGERPRLRRPGLHGLSHVHGAGAGLSDGRRTAHRASGAAGAEGVVPQQQPHSGPGRSSPGYAASGERRRNRSIRNRGGEQLREAVRAVDWDGAESRFAAIAKGSVGEAYNHLQFAIQDEVDVHRVVLAWRAWAMLELSGEEYAHTLLRQSVRYCVNTEQSLRDQQSAAVRRAPRAAATVGPVPPVGQAARRSPKPTTAGSNSSRGRSSPARASRPPMRPPVHWPKEWIPKPWARRFRWPPTCWCCTIRAAARRTVRRRKPPGCVHGDSVGVHASDAANAWRNIARVSNPRNQVASLIVGAYHTAGQTDRVTKDPYPLRRACWTRSMPRMSRRCSARPRKRSRATTRPGRAPWCIATAN